MKYPQGTDQFFLCVALLTLTVWNSFNTLSLITAQIPTSSQPQWRMTHWLLKTMEDVSAWNHLRKCNRRFCIATAWVDWEKTKKQKTESIKAMVGSFARIQSEYQLIYWDLFFFGTSQNSLWRQRKYPVSWRCADLNVLLISGVRGHTGWRPKKGNQWWQPRRPWTHHTSSIWKVSSFEGTWKMKTRTWRWRFEATRSHQTEKEACV